jgi:lipopolysaccharide heptosyltransferase II
MKSWDNAQEILCIRLDSMGDLIMTGPALRAIKEGERRLTLLTSPAGAATAQLLPEVDAVLTYEAPWMKATPLRAGSQTDLAMVEQLRHLHFDAAVIFTVFSQNPLPSAMLCYLADIPLRLAHCHENPYQLLTDWVPDPEPGEILRHEVRRQLDLVARVGYRTDDERLAVRIPPSARQRIARVLRERAFTGDKWVVIHPGASAPSRRYAPVSFAAVARELTKRYGWRVVFTGSAAERDLIAGIQQQAGVPTSSLVAELDLGELAALLASAPLLISNNTGPAHLAAAVGTPVVDLYALTNPQHTPWGTPARVLSHDVPCRSCFKSICPEGHHHCLALVTPEQVVQAAVELHAEQRPREGEPPAMLVTH